MGAAVMAIGTVISGVAALQQAKSAQKAEQIRKRQMNLEAVRQKREIVRQGIRARAEALSTATAQGGAESSGLQGGYGQIAGQQNRALLANEQDRKLGNKMFSANADYAKWGGIGAAGSGLSSLGSQMSGKTVGGFTL
jgi:hypothetical protein